MLKMASHRRAVAAAAAICFSLAMLAMAHHLYWHDRRSPWLAPPVRDAAPLPAPPPLNLTEMRPELLRGVEACRAYRAQGAELPETVMVPFAEVLSRESLPPQWLQELVQHGLAPQTDPRSVRTSAPHGIDVVVSWVDAGNVDFARNKSAWETVAEFDDLEAFSRENVNRHRDWGELRYLVRSVFRFLPQLNSLVLVAPAASKPYASKVAGGGTGERPPWMAAVGVTDRANVYSLSQDVLLADSSSCNPVFSSVAVEAGLPDLPETGGLPRNPQDILYYLNDDMMLLRNVSMADIYSPFAGYMISFDYDFPQLFNERERPPFNRDEWIFGEWPFLKATSYAMNTRFGQRDRPYTRHNGHPLSRSILREIKQTFPRLFHDSVAHRWRGEVPAVHVWSAFYWYLIERHREALLWSVLALKFDDDGEQETVSVGEKADILHLAEPNLSPDLHKRSSLATLSENAARLGLDMFATSYAYWSSWDGPLWLSQQAHRDPPRLDREAAADAEGHMPTGPVYDSGQLDGTCDMEKLRQCLALDRPEQASAMLDRFVRQAPECGDCLSNALLRASGDKGMSAFLPSPAAGALHYQGREVVDVHGRTYSRYEAATRVIARYSYSVANMDAGYIHLVAPDQARSKLRSWAQQRPGQVCLNDHMDSRHSQQEVEEMRHVLDEFFSSVYGGGDATSPVEV